MLYGVAMFGTLLRTRDESDAVAFRRAACPVPRLLRPQERL